MDNFVFEKTNADGSKQYAFADDKKGSTNPEDYTELERVIKFGEDGPAEIAVKDHLNDIKIINAGGGIGQIFGSVIGRHIAGDNVVLGVVLDGVLGTIGENLFELGAALFTGSDVIAAIW